MVVLNSHSSIYLKVDNSVIKKLGLTKTEGDYINEHLLLLGVLNYVKNGSVSLHEQAWHGIC